MELATSCMIVLRKKKLTGSQFLDVYNARMSYVAPTQRRAQETERKFLLAFEELLRTRGFVGTSIDDIAARASLNRSAFLSRFGSKEGALMLLFRRYCMQASEAMSNFSARLDSYQSAHIALCDASSEYEALLRAHLGANRAMHEHFVNKLEVHDMTKEIFRQSVEMMSQVQAHFLQAGEYGAVGAQAAAQFLVTTNYNYVLKAMPALPSDDVARHSLIADILLVSLKR